MSLAISIPDLAKFLTINERASLRRAEKACKKIELIPRDKIQELYENNHKTVAASYPTYSANSAALCNKIADETCLDIIKMTESEGCALSNHALQYWIYPLIHSIENKHAARTKHAVIAPPDR